MKLSVKFTSKFKKDGKRIARQGKDIEHMFLVIEKLANLEKLEEKYRDHQLTGNFADYRECHLAPDWLLIYKVCKEELILVLTRTGSHSDLF